MYRRDSIDSNKPEEDEEERRKFEINTVFDKDNKERQFMSNLVRTTKYTCINFLPKNLWEQFTKLANAYFLMMGLIQLIPGVAPEGGFATTVTPLSLVVLVSMVKDIFEDRKRRVKDTEENQSPC